MANSNNAVADVILKISLDDSNINSQIKNGTSAVASGASSMFGSVLKANLMTSAITAGISLVKNFFSQLTSGAQDAYRVQLEAELKLETVMKQRMKATDAEIQKVKDLASELQGIGIIGDEVSLSGMQQLATFATQTETIETLMPALQNLLAQQKGYNATAGDAVNIGNLMGKVLQGQTSALTRVGITFSEAQEQILKYGTESEKAATLAQVITDNVGSMNEALANTEYGKQVQLSNTIGDIKEKVGDFITIMKGNFIDTMVDVVGWIDKAVDKAIDFAEAIGDFMEEMGWKKKVEEVEAVNDAIEVTEEALEEVKKTTGELAGFDKFNLFGSSSNSLTADADAIEASSEAISDGVENMKEGIEETSNSFSEFFDELKNSRAWDIASDAVDEFKNKHLDNLSSAWQRLSREAGEAWSSFAGFFLGDEDLTFFDALVLYVTECVDQIAEALWIIVDGVGGIIEMFNNIGEVGIFDKPYEGFEGFSLFGVPLIETVDSYEKHQTATATASSQTPNITVTPQYSPNIYIGNDQLITYTIDEINHQSVLKGYSVIK